MKSKTFDLILDEENAINFKPSSQEEEIIQNIYTICTTRKGSRPMDRDFGINFLVVDQPLVKEQARLTQEITDAISKYEPRAEILEINFGWSKQHNSLWPRVKIAVKNS